jgi:hypothetical protein
MTKSQIGGLQRQRTVKTNEPEVIGGGGGNNKGAGEHIKSALKQSMGSQPSKLASVMKGNISSNALTGNQNI